MKQRQQEISLDEDDEEEPDAANWKHLAFHALIYYLYHDDYPAFELVRPADEVESDTYDNGILKINPNPNEEGSRKLYSLVNYPHDVNHLQEVEEYEDWLYGRLMLVLMVYIYIAADYYDIESLRAKVTHDFYSMTKEKMFWDTEEFKDAIPLIYNQTVSRRDEQGLRDVVADVLSINMTELFADERVQDMVFRLDDLASTIVMQGHQPMNG